MIQRKSFALLLYNTINTIKEEGEHKYYYMSLVDYRKYMGHPDSMPTKYIAKELEELMTKIIEWDIDEYGNGTRSVMLAGFEIENFKLKWAFSPFLIDKLLADKYTPLKLSIIINFKSKYSLALYENLQVRKSFKKIKFTLEEFRALMGVEKEEYARMTNFKNKVLSPALKEINEKSDMKVFYKDIKKGAKIVAFEFDIELLTSKQIKERDKRKEKEEAYRKVLKNRFGQKIVIGGKNIL